MPNVADLGGGAGAERGGVERRGFTAAFGFALGGAVFVVVQPGDGDGDGGVVTVDDLATGVGMAGAEHDLGIGAPGAVGEFARAGGGGDTGIGFAQFGAVRESVGLGLFQGGEGGGRGGRGDRADGRLRGEIAEGVEPGGGGGGLAFEGDDALAELGAFGFGREQGVERGGAGGEAAANNFDGLGEKAVGIAKEGELLAGAEELEEGVAGIGEELEFAAAAAGGGDLGFGGGDGAAAFAVAGEGDFLGDLKFSLIVAEEAVVGVALDFETDDGIGPGGGGSDAFAVGGGAGGVGAELRVVRADVGEDAVEGERLLREERGGRERGEEGREGEAEEMLGGAGEHGGGREVGKWRRRMIGRPTKPTNCTKIGRGLRSARKTRKRQAVKTRWGNADA